MGPARREHRLPVACLVAVWVALILAQANPWFEMCPDTAVYLELSRSLAAGEGYSAEGQLRRPYPPGFPFLLSLAARMGGPGFLAERLLVAFFGLGAMLTSYALLAQRYQGRQRLVASLIVGVCPSLVYASTLLLSDVPFLCLGAAFMASAAWYWRSPRLRWRAALLAAVLLLLAVLVRTAGVAYYVASMLWVCRPALWRRDRRRCAVFAVLLLIVACPPAVAWHLRARARAPNEADGYVERYVGGGRGGHPLLSWEWLRRRARRMAFTVPRHVGGATQLVLAARADLRYAWWGVPVLAVGLLGLLRRWRRAEFVDCCFALYALMVLLWPGTQGTRFWLPMLPLGVGYLADGAERLGRLTRRVPVQFLGAGALLSVGLWTGARLVHEARGVPPGPVGHVVFQPGGSRDVAAFLRSRPGQDAVLAWPWPLLVRPAIRGTSARVVRLPFDAEASPPEALRALEDQGATHVALARAVPPPQGQAAVPSPAQGLLAALPSRLRRAERTKFVDILEVLPAPGADPRGNPQ